MFEDVIATLDAVVDALNTADLDNLGLEHNGEETP